MTGISPRGAPARPPERGREGSGHGLAHRVVALVDVDHGPVMPDARGLDRNAAVVPTSLDASDSFNGELFRA